MHLIYLTIELHICYTLMIYSYYLRHLNLQYNIAKVNEFCNNWGLSVNVDKSKVMIF